MPSEFPVSVLVAFIVLFVCAGSMVYIWFAGERSRVDGRAANDSPRGRVLVFAAAVGGGHEAAGRMARAELERAGYAVVMTDGLRKMSPIVNWLLVRGYKSQARRKPGTLEVIFNITSRRTGAAIVRGLVGFLFAHRLIRILRREGPRLVISTYPLVTAALGHLRKTGKLRVPAIALIADYGVHPLWVDPRVDLHLVASGRSAALAEHARGPASVVRIPVAPELREAPRREEARTALGLCAKDFVVLIVGGAWGIGDLGQAARCAAASGACTLVVTGSNTALENRLRKEFSHVDNVRIFGWRRDLPVLMAASDCLIQNAGGMTCIEAIEMGLPVVMFDPIPGHGEFNVRIMEKAGVAHWSRSTEELVELLRFASRGEISLRVPIKRYPSPTLSEAIGPLIQDAPQPTVARRSISLNLRPVALTAIAVLVSFLWLAFASPGVSVAARELDVKIPGYAPSPGRVSLGISVEAPKTAASLEALARRKHVPVTIFANSQSASGLSPAADLTFGVVEEPAKSKLSLWSERRRSRLSAVEVRRATGAYPDYFLAAPRTNLAALADAPPDTRLVMPEKLDRGKLHPGLLILDSSNLGPEATRRQFLQTLQQVENEGFRCVPLSRL